MHFLPFGWPSATTLLVRQSLQEVGRDQAINHLLFFYWAAVSRLEWVASDLNIADPFSRNDCPIGETRGWLRLASGLEPLWDVFERVAADLDCALDGAVREVLAMRWQFQ